MPFFSGRSAITGSTCTLVTSLGRTRRLLPNNFMTCCYFSGLRLAIAARTRTLPSGLKPRFRLLWMPKDKRGRRRVPGPPRPLFCSSCTAIARKRGEPCLPTEIPLAAHADSAGPGASHRAAPQRRLTLGREAGSKAAVLQ